MTMTMFMIVVKVIVCLKHWFPICWFLFFQIYSRERTWR
jgi:hypothetical protein